MRLFGQSLAPCVTRWQLNEQPSIGTSTLGQDG